MRRMGVGGYSGYSAPPSDDDDVGEHELCPQVQAWVEARSAREYGTALHESGHCVAALALRKPIDSLVLFSDRAGVFRHYPPAKSAPTPPSKPVVIEPSDPALHDSITIDLAGLAAEMKAPIGSTDFAAGISGDMGQVHRLLDRHCVNAAQKRFLIWYCTDRAHDIINANWPIVEALARALQRMRLMSKPTFSRLCAVPVLLVMRCLANSRRLRCAFDTRVRRRPLWAFATMDACLPNY